MFLKRTYFIYFKNKDKEIEYNRNGKQLLSLLNFHFVLQESVASF